MDGGIGLTRAKLGKRMDFAMFRGFRVYCFDGGGEEGLLRKY